MKHILRVLGFCVAVFAFAIATAAQDTSSCALAPRLAIGTQGRVLPGDPNNVRDSASRGGAMVGAIAGGAIFDVLDGPVCADNMYWWQVTDGTITGWTVEGAQGEYWVAPYIPPTPTPAPELTEFVPPIEAINTLSVGAQVRVINDDFSQETITLVIRTQPAREASTVTRAAEGDLLTIVGGPEESEGLRWWQVKTAGGSEGWAIEGMANAARENAYERTLLAICPAEGRRLVYRITDYVATSDTDGNNFCVLDKIDQLAWMTFSSTNFNFINQFPVSSDGLYMLFTSRDGFYRLKLDGSENLRLRNGQPGWAAWSPDGTKIAMATGSQIAVMNADGSRFAFVTQGEAHRTWVGWQDDSETLIYAEQNRMRDQMGTSIIYTFYRINLREGGLRVLLETPEELVLSEVAISPDGKMLAVGGSRYGLIIGMHGQNVVYRYDFNVYSGSTTWILDLEKEEVITELETWLNQPGWLPDNSGIAREFYPHMQVLAIDDGILQNIPISGDIPVGDYRQFLAWVSDSAYLTYIGYGFRTMPEDFKLWRVDIATGESVRLK